MVESNQTCRKCGVTVLEGTVTCPQCEYDVTTHNRHRFWLGLTGTVLTLTIVLSPIGLPLLWMAHQHRQRAEGTVATTPQIPLNEHLAAVMRHHVKLTSPSVPDRDFTRSGSRSSSWLGRPPQL